MDRSEAAMLLRRELAAWARRPHEELVHLVDDVEAWTVEGPSGIVYQVELNAYWEGQPGGAIRVLAGIDDGSFRGAFRPVTDGFLRQPDGSVEMAAGPDEPGR